MSHTGNLILSNLYNPGDSIFLISRDALQFLPCWAKKYTSHWNPKVCPEIIHSFIIKNIAYSNGVFVHYFDFYLGSLTLSISFIFQHSLQSSLSGFSCHSVCSFKSYLWSEISLSFNSNSQKFTSSQVWSVDRKSLGDAMFCQNPCMRYEECLETFPTICEILRPDSWTANLEFPLIAACMHST